MVAGVSITMALPNTLMAKVAMFHISEFISELRLRRVNRTDNGVDGNPHAPALYALTVEGVMPGASGRAALGRAVLTGPAHNARDLRSWRPGPAKKAAMRALAADTLPAAIVFVVARDSRDARVRHCMAVPLR